MRNKVEASVDCHVSIQIKIYYSEQTDLCYQERLSVTVCFKILFHVRKTSQKQNRMNIIYSRIHTA